MAYTKTNWQDLPNQTTPINATNLNHIETGIEDNDKRLNGNSIAGDMVVNSIKTKNLFNVDDRVNGYVIASNGAINATANFCYSEYIKVKPSTQYTISLSNWFSGDAMRIAEYTSTKTFINRPITDGSAPWTFTTPSNCEYIRLSYQYLYGGDLINTNIQLEEGSNATTYTPFQNLAPYSNNYSIEDVIVGKWINGKNIYRKVVHVNALPNNTSSTYNLNLTNVDSVIKIYGMARGSSGNVFPLPYVDKFGGSNHNIELTYLSSGTQARIVTSNDRSGLSADIIVEYTKTS